jgi:drug/metabolite transporter (DMT)-like permease
MSAGRLAGIVLIVAGVLALVYHSFSYTKDSHDAKIGPVELSVKNKETVDVPTWAGVAAILVGGALLLVGNRKG